MARDLADYEKAGKALHRPELGAVAQPLTTADEEILDRAWEKTAGEEVEPPEVPGSEESDAGDNPDDGAASGAG